MISNSVEPSAQGRIQGANQGMQSIARILGPLIGAGLYIYGASWPYIFGAILVFAGTWILVAFNTKTITKDYLTT